MTIKLLRFPILIIIKILESMPSTDKVLFSFCSSKMSRLIRMVKWRVSIIQYKSYKSHTYIFLGSPKFDHGGYFKFRDVDEFSENSKIFREKTLGLQYGIFASTVLGWAGAVVEVLKNSKYFSRLLFHNLIADLFRNPPVIEYDVGSGFNLTNTYFYETMKNMCLSGIAATPDYAEEYFSKAMDLQCAVVFPVIRPQLNTHSKLTTAKYLYFKNTFYQATTLPLHFNGHRAVFYRSIYNKRTIVEIMKRWNSNEGFQNLQTLEIFSSRNRNFNVDEIQREVNARPWDGLRRPENFGKEDRVMGVRFKPIECANFLDIVRESDGKVASFLVTEKMFKFCVWN
ncbi:unnamed protein product [Caenorhabditis brenneri]